MDKADAAETKMKKKPHVLFIPLCAQGHMIPALSIAKQLARHSVAVTFVGHRAEISRLIAEEDPEPHTREFLRFMSLPRLDVVETSPNEGAALLEKSFKEVITNEQLSGSEGPTCILSDMFIDWSTDLALQLQIPRYTFMASGAVATRLLQASEDLFDQGKLRATADGLQLEKFDGQISAPALPGLRYHEIPVNFRYYPLLFKDSAKLIMETAAIVVNTFYELEPMAIDTLRKLAPTKAQKFYPVGPLFLTSLVSPQPIHGLESSAEKCLRWLDSQPRSSVLYVCFGTLWRPDALQIRELALGLQNSKHRFLWVLREPEANALLNMNSLDPEQAKRDTVLYTDVLPPGFEAEVGELGYILRGWAPQIQVLSHPATGGFLTHCGWNSCLEAISMGVPMLAWPVSAEQHVNCRYLVDEVKVASEIHQGSDGIVKQKEVERAVRLLMVEEEGVAMKGRLELLKVQAAAAMAVGGSSTLAIQELAQDIKNL